MVRCGVSVSLQILCWSLCPYTLFCLSLYLFCVSLYIHSIALFGEEVNKKQLLGYMSLVFTHTTLIKVFHDLRFDAHILQKVCMLNAAKLCVSVCLSSPH